MYILRTLRHLITCSLAVMGYIIGLERNTNMSIEQMRYALKNNTKYRGSYKWINRVNVMHDNQVFAVYMRMLRAGEILE